MSWNEQKDIKNHPKTLSIDFKKNSQILIIFGENIFRHYLASNDFSSHLTKCLLLHYLEKCKKDEIG